MGVQKSTVKIFICFIAISSILGTAAGANNVTLSLLPKLSEAGAGETFIVNVELNPNNNNVFAAQFDLIFDPELLEGISVEKGQVLKQDGVQTVNPIPERINNSIGKIEYAETRMGVDTGVNNPGTLAIITFKVKETAKTGENHSFSLKNVIATDNVPNMLSVDLNSGDFKVIESGSQVAGTPRAALEKKQVITRELSELMNKSSDTEKISVKITVDQADSVQNLLNLATFLNSRGTEVSDIKQLPDSITTMVSKKVINEISSLPYVTEITIYKEAEAPAKGQPGFGTIITVSVLLLSYLNFRKRNKI